MNRRKPKQNKKNVPKAATVAAIAKSVAKKVEAKIHPKQKHKQHSAPRNNTNPPGEYAGKQRRTRGPKPNIAMSGIIPLQPAFAQASVTRDKIVIEEANENFLFVDGDPGFVNNLFFINPGNTKLFPVFSNIAQCYTNYKLISFSLTYLTESYQISSGVTAGNVYLVINYNSQEPAFNSAKEILQYNPHLETVPFSSGTLVAEKLGADKTKGYVDGKPYRVFVSDNLPNPTGGAASSVFDYNVGTAQVATNANAVTTEIGKVRVCAKFALWGLHAPVPNDKSPVLHARAQALTGAPFTNATIQQGSSYSFDCTFTNTTITLAQMAIGSRFMITYNAQATGGSATITVGTTIVSTGCIGVNLQIGGTEDVFSAGSTTATFSNCSTFLVTTGTCVLTYPTITVTSTPAAQADVWITLLPTNLISQNNTLEDKVLQLEKTLAKVQLLETQLNNRIDAFAGESDYDDIVPEAKTPSIPVTAPVLRRQA
jgi:hypothetical protein